MGERRTVLVAVRISPAESAIWRAKASAAGVPLSALLRRAMAHTRTWTAPAAEVERERTRQVLGVAQAGKQLVDSGRLRILGRRLLSLPYPECFEVRPTASDLGAFGGAQVAGKQAALRLNYEVEPLPASESISTAQSGL